MPWVQCTFVPTPAFAPYQPLFEAAQQALTDPNDVLWEQLYGQIDGLGLLRREGRSKRLIGKKGTSNGRWIVGIKLAWLINDRGEVVDRAWDTADTPDTVFATSPCSTTDKLSR